MRKLFAAIFCMALLLTPAYLHTASALVQAAATVMAGLIAAAYIASE